MNKVLFLVVSTIALFVLAFSSAIPGQAATQQAIMPSGPINIAHFFKPPNMDPATAARNFNMIVLTNGDHTYRDQLAASGFSSTIPEYFRSDGIQDPGSCTATPLNNQVAYKRGDFCSISASHPDWFLLDQYGRRITVTTGGLYYRMDPANPGWREFFLARVVESQNLNGWSALFLDNVEGGLGKYYGSKPARYPDNASYQNAIAGFLQYLYVNYSQRYSRPIMGNIVARADDAVWFTYLQYLAGAMQERFAVDWDETTYLSVSRWQSDMAFMERTQANGKYVILVAPGNQNDSNRQNFAFASYLLISNGKAAFRYSTDDEYRNVWLYDNYKLNLGSPIGPRYLSGTVWRRDFTRGNVVVDPARHTAVITASGPQTPSPIGVFRPSNGTFYLKKANTIGVPDYTFIYGQAGDYPITGDWDGNGTDTIGIYRNGIFYLRNSNSAGNANLTFAFGSPGDQPIAGDWNGDGKDTIGVYRRSTFTFYLRNSNTAGPAEMTFSLGLPGDVGIAGDWNQDGRDTTGVFRPSNGVIFLKNSNQTGYADVALNYGLPGDKPVVGDWDHDGDDTIGVYRGSTFYLRNSNTVGYADIWFPFGTAGDLPIAGNWDGS
jgi:putative glycosyl hydrolase-like family 15 (GHL15) protein